MFLLQCGTEEAYQPTATASPWKGSVGRYSAAGHIEGGETSPGRGTLKPFSRRFALHVEQDLVREIGAELLAHTAPGDATY